MSVPYALHAKTAENVINDEVNDADADPTNEIELPTSGNAGDMNYWNGSAWVAIAATANEGATLQMIGGVPTWTGGTPPIAKVGDFAHGGIVFWVNGNGGGLVCAIHDQSYGVPWYNGEYTATGATATAIGTGQANTTAIIANQGAIETNYAAGVAKAYEGGGYTDWFLPSKDELNEMYLNRVIIGVTAVSNGGGGFAYLNFWSSAEYGITMGWEQNFSNGSQNGNIKFYMGRVRAVRAF
ncbi:MAG: DUF1566 domain-containing protein [Flavobacteriales bacterium]|nr:DUF1566 domain-containing protein [Flavobacteriales bacterium]